MALWTARIETLQLNDFVNFALVEFPQADDLPPGENILVEHAGDWPDFVRWQPTSGLATVNLFAGALVGGVFTSCSEAQWAQRIDAIKAVLSPGLHTFAFQGRGWTTEKSVLAGYRSMGTSYRTRGISLELFIPKPVWT